MKYLNLIIIYLLISIESFALAPISGATTGCAGIYIQLEDTTLGGTWSSSNTTVATVTAFGSVLGIVAGTATISYTVGGASATTVVTIKPSIGSIKGYYTTVCPSSTFSLSDAVTGGIWTSNNTSIATVDSLTGVVNTHSGGAAGISYALSGCILSQSIYVANPIPIYGCDNVGVGDDLTLHAYDDPYGFFMGYFFSYGPYLTGGAYVGDVVDLTGISPGVATVYFMSSTGCVSSRSVTVTPATLIKPITGVITVCPGSTFAVSDSTGGGIWSSSNTAVETISSLGLVTAITSGGTVISYSLSPYTCTSPSGVASPPTPIRGPSTVCAGDTIYLSSTTAGGGDIYWGGDYSSSDTNIAQNVTFYRPEEPGMIKGISAGVATITFTDIYDAPYCYTIKTITVTPSPVPAISGYSGICAGGTLVLSDSVTGGIWSIADTTLATINPSTGKLNGIAGGSDIVYYTVTSGSCGPTTRSLPISVTTSTPIVGLVNGSDSLCDGSSIILSDTSAGGIWSSGNTHVARVDSSTGVLSGLSPGTSLITYTVSNVCGSSISAVTVTVNPLPMAISGSDSVCEGASTLLSDAGGGTWLSTNIALATVGSTGMVTGVLYTGIPDTIIYTLPTGCANTVTIRVLALPSPIVSLDSICAGSSMTLSDTITGGAWSSGTTAVAAIGSATGILYGVSAGDVSLTYTLATGCVAVRTISVNPLPFAITGVTHVCPSDSVALTDAGGGTWTSDHLSVASVDSLTGVVTGVSTGSATISYVLSTGCATSTLFTTDLLHIPSVSIVDTADTVCAGSYIAFGASPVNGGTLPHYQWTVNGTNTGTDTNYYYYIPADSDVVGVTLTSNAACATPDTASKTLMVYVVTVPLPTIAIAAIPGIAIAKGQSDTLTATVTGGGLAPVYQWLINGLPVAGATSATFICDSFRNNDSVTCIAANSGACIYATFNSVIINVSTLITTPISKTRTVKIFPNPTQNELTITSSDQIITMVITNLIGQSVYSNNYHSKDVQVDVSGLPTGMYLIRINDTDVRKFVKE